MELKSTLLLVEAFPSLRSNKFHTTLTIANISESPAGVYEVKFAGFSIYPHNNYEKETLTILRHYPVLSPVFFHVYTDGKRSVIFTRDY